MSRNGKRLLQKHGDSRGPVGQSLGCKTELSAYPEHPFVIGLDCSIDFLQPSLFADPYELVCELVSQALSMKIVVDKDREFGGPVTRFYDKPADADESPLSPSLISATIAISRS